ncbi:MAG TPA: LysE family transporter [Hyphomicrobiaceae bacterium]|nr:LysE family transporter [Hyphomicrobiaceae bacterium]
MIDLLPNPLIIPIGISIGILVAAPVGPVNVLCIQRALERGFWGGVAAGAGAVLGDVLIALSAAMGVGAISGAVKYYRVPIQFVGGLVLIGFGFRLMFAAPHADDTARDDHAPRLGDYLWDLSRSFVLTVTNPAAVLGLFAIFGGIGSFVELSGAPDALLLVVAVAIGSLSWWVFLSAMVSWIKLRFNVLELSRINRIAGIFLVGFGCLLVGELALKPLNMLVGGLVGSIAGPYRFL